MMKTSTIWTSARRATIAVSTVLTAAAILWLPPARPARAAEDSLAGVRPPKESHEQRPVVPTDLEPPTDHELAFRAYAEGVQIYVCRNTATNSPAQYGWVFVAPTAVLYMSEDGEARADWHLVGIHNPGPTWEFKDGSKVMGKVLERSVSPKAGAVPWLLLQATNHVGRGKFASVTYIQRVETDGGVAPAAVADAAHEGQEVLVPYSADYLFYRQAK